jgi:hypothetical protein
VAWNQENIRKDLADWMELFSEELRPKLVRPLVRPKTVEDLFTNCLPTSLKTKDVFSVGGFSISDIRLLMFLP